jgi:hypothetical protein
MVSGSPEDASVSTNARLSSGIGEAHGTTSGDSKVAQCNNELAALKVVNAASYGRYRTEMNHLVASGKRYMNVQGGISNDINDIMMPRYQFGMASLCWRIRNALSQSLMKQADIPQGREP